MKLIIGLMLILLMQGCLPLLVGGVIGYEVSKNDAVKDAQHRERMDVEKARLDALNKQVEIEQTRRIK